MVSPAGEAYEIAVTESSGGEAFEREALKALRRSKFIPATLEGKPVDAGFTAKITFVLDGRSRARAKFIQNFESLTQAIEAGDKAAADAHLATLNGENLYELAYAGAAKYEYFLKWGSEAEQLETLTQAIAAEKKPTYLPKGLFNTMLQIMLRLQLLKHDFGSASATWTTLQENEADPKVLASFKPTMDDVAKLRTDDRSFEIQGEIGSNRLSWFTQLHKKKFRVAVSSGKIVEVKLRCDKRYVFFAFDPGLEYRVADPYGACSLELVGDPGTQFKLRQS
jgi:TonB family protein